MTPVNPSQTTASTPNSSSLPQSNNNNNALNSTNSNSPSVSTAPTAIYHQPSAVAAAVQAAAASSVSTTSQASPPSTTASQQQQSLMPTPHQYFQMGYTNPAFLQPQMYALKNSNEENKGKAGGAGSEGAGDKKSNQAPLLQHNMYRKCDNTGLE